MSEIDWDSMKGSTHYVPDWGFFKCENGEWFTEDRGVWRKTPYASPENFSWFGAAIKRPSAWSGEGLPPVGTVCEDDAGNEVVIVAHHVNGVHAIFAESLEAGLLYYGAAGDFRPIRTPEQIAAEEREKAVKEMETVAAKAWRATPIGMDMITEICSALYDAGFHVPKQ